MSGRRKSIQHSWNFHEIYAMMFVQSTKFAFYFFYIFYCLPSSLFTEAVSGKKLCSFFRSWFSNIIFLYHYADLLWSCPTILCTAKDTSLKPKILNQSRNQWTTGFVLIYNIWRILKNRDLCFVGVKFLPYFN